VYTTEGKFLIVNFSSEERDKKASKVITLKKPTVNVAFAQIARLVSKRREDIICKMAVNKMMMNKRGKAGR
jgi:hypothetical protein